MLKNNYSYWEKTSFLDYYDVIIIGAGIVGLNAALNLKIKAPKLKVSILERGFLPSGASTKNAGFACFGSASELLKEIQTDGEDVVLKLVEKRIKGLETLRNNLGDSDIDFRQKSGFELFLNEDKNQMEFAIDSIEYLNKILHTATKSTDTFSVANAKINSFGFNNVIGLIENHLEGQIDTGKMMMSLINKVQSLGVLVFNSCEFLSFKEENNQIEILTNQGTFKTKKLLFATNAFTKLLIPQLDIKPARGQVLVTKKIKNLKIDGTFHYQEGYYYFRDIDDRILLGGGRNLDFKGEETYDLDTTNQIQDKLISLLHSVILPKEKIEVDYNWSGIMGFGEKLNPIIEKIRENLYVAARCNGMGIAIGSLSGKEIATLILNDL